MLLFAPVLVLTLVGLSIYLALAILGTHRWRTFVGVATVVFLLWSGGMAIVVYEPFELLAWFAD
jgi:hypothetical protein